MVNTVPLRLLDCLGLLPGVVFGLVVCDLAGGREAVVVEEGGKEDEVVEEEAGGGGRSRIADGEGILMLSMPWDCDVDADVVYSGV